MSSFGSFTVSNKQQTLQQQKKTNCSNGCYPYRYLCFMISLPRQNFGIARPLRPKFDNSWFGHPRRCGITTPNCCCCCCCCEFSVGYWWDDIPRVLKLLSSYFGTCCSHRRGPMCTCFVLRIDRRKTSTSSVSIFALSLEFLEIQFSDLVGLLDGTSWM